MPKDEMTLTPTDQDILKTYRVDHTWLGCVDLVDTGKVSVEIEKVLKVKGATFEGGRKEDGQALAFKGARKMLFLNGTNTRRLYEKYGRTAAELIGQRITLVVTKLERPFNGHEYGIRIQ